MELQVDKVLYGWLVAMLVMGAVSSAVMVAAPTQFIALQKRLVHLVGFPEGVFEPFWQRFPLRIVGAVYLAVSIGVLYFLLVVDPDFFNKLAR